MNGFIYGTVLMYLLGSALMLAITDSADPDRPNAHIWLAATWPFVAVLSIYEMLMYNIRGGDDE